DQAMTLAAQTVMGTGKYLLQTGEHPGQLKDRVCSPAGTTIEGVRALEEGGLRNALIDAVLRAARRSQELGQS
ncbi:MAG: pyrroline-5-carboxylate reductase family protein, partial [Armatimonadota bacterium]